MHGELHHLKANTNIVLDSVGISQRLLGKNGDLFFIAPVKGIRRNAVKTGRLSVINKKLVQL